MACCAEWPGCGHSGTVGPLVRLELSRDHIKRVIVGLTYEESLSIGGCMVLPLCPDVLFRAPASDRVCVDVSKREKEWIRFVFAVGQSQERTDGSEGIKLLVCPFYFRGSDGSVLIPGSMAFCHSRPLVVPTRREETPDRVPAYIRIHPRSPATDRSAARFRRPTHGNDATLHGKRTRQAGQWFS